MKTSALFLCMFLLTPGFALAQGRLEVGDRFHINGCENGELLVPLVNIWRYPEMIRRSEFPLVVGQLSGQGRADGAGRCQGAVVTALEIRAIGGRTHIKIESIVNGLVGWITDSFIGKEFDKARCREHFDEKAQVERCEG